MCYYFIVREKNNVVGGCGRSRVRMRRWFGSHGCSCDLPSLYLGSCTTEKTEMARILMLVVCGSLLSFGELSVLVNQVLASIQF